MYPVYAFSTSMSNHLHNLRLCRTIYILYVYVECRLEVHADVNADGGAACRRKNSLGSVRTLSNADSHSLGPDNRSVRSFLQDNRSHVSFSVDNASVKALAGSISAPRYVNTSWY